MREILLSIVVPTKNRAEYLKSFIDLYSSFDGENTELVIQDNSDSESEIGQYIKNYPKLNIVYNYISKSLPVIENSELAIAHSHGKYVCFMGDDDLLSKYVVNVVQKMDEANIESVVFKKAQYNWPNVSFVCHKFPNLIIPNFSGKIYHLDSKEEFDKLLRRGATRLENVPQLYHGVIKREVLDRIKNVTGTFFPGPSPDMAIATCLSCFVSSHVFLDAPFISSGRSPKSAAGLGAKHEHKGDLKSMPFLPSNIEEKWDNRLPFIWTGPTIYAQSAIEAIKSIGLENRLREFDFSYFYAWFDIFCAEYSGLTISAKKNVKINRKRYFISKVMIFLLRAKKYVDNKLLLRFHLGGLLFDGVENCVEAEKIIDDEIEKKIDMKKLNFKDSE